MNNFGAFLLGSITGAVALGALAWKFGDDSVSDSELDEIASDADKTVKRCDEIIEEAERLEKENEAIINFNIFDYYCFRRISKKRAEIELFNFGINFYKKQMDIINFFNIIILTQIMLTQQTDKKQNNLKFFCFHIGCTWVPLGIKKIHKFIDVIPCFIIFY